MNLKCMINGKVSGVFLPSTPDNNRLIQGNTIAEEYSETLDSGAIILSDSPKINNLDPYDDVFIWDCDFLPNFDGITKTTDANGCIVADYSIFEDTNHNKKFYKHFLVDRYTEERNLLNQDNYTYKIELFSETKGMETVVLPNIIITQPLDADKRLSTFTYMMQFLELYSPKIKVKVGNTWEYRQKYGLSPEMYNLFRNHYCQQFSLNSPTLRELFTKLMVSKDCIPVVKDNVIYPLMLGQTTGDFNISNYRKSFIVVNKSSDGYVTQFRTNYNNALTAGPTCHRVEHLGLRNSDEAIMTINNMRLETGFPIYKLNKVYVCYYKKCAPLYNSEGHQAVRNWHYFLCRQDITDFCVLSNERQALYKDARIASNQDLSLAEMKDCYYYTLAYSIGSNLITGFGEMFSYLSSDGLSTWDSNECIIRNLVNRLDKMFPYGVDGKADLAQKLQQYLIDNQGTEPYWTTQMDDVYVDTTAKFKGFKAGLNEDNWVPDGTVPSIFLDYKEGDPAKLQGDSIVIKGLTFEIDYEGFYNGAIVTNKETYKKQIMKVDNQSDSMPILDVDGIAKERKIEKMSNKMYTITARYTNWDDVQNIGTILKIGGEEENQDDIEEIIIYHRDISLYDNCIDVVYYGQESFVLKNFYTSVFAKQRLYNVLDYGNSITRAENIKDIILFSRNRQYSIPQNIITHTPINYFNLKNYLSCLCEEDDNLSFEYPIDTATMRFYDVLNNQEVMSANYFADINTFITGNSMCVNTKMFDNITMGTYVDVSHLSGKFWLNGNAWVNGNKNTNYAGSTQKLCSVHNDRQTGRSEYIELTFLCAENVQSEIYRNTTDVANWQAKRLELPSYFQINNIIALASIRRKLYKDVNETMDITFQTQLLVDKKNRRDIFLGNNLLKYNNLIKSKKAKGSLSSLTSANVIYLVPFQYIVDITKTDTPLDRNKASLVGFIVRVPNSIMNDISNQKFTINFVLQMGLEDENDLNRVKTDTLISDETNAEILEWKMELLGTDNVYFSELKSGLVEFVRITYNSIQVLRKSNVSNFSENGYFYLEQIDKNFIDESPGIDKADYTYYTNVNMNDYYDPSGNDPQKLPILNNYFKNNSVPSGSFDSNDIISYMPADKDFLGRSARYNNMFYSFTPSNLYLEPDDIFTPTIETNQNFTPFGVPDTGYISNYFSPNANCDSCVALGQTKELLTYNIVKTSTMGNSQGIQTIGVFQDLNVSTQAYFTWIIGEYEEETPEIEIIPDGKLICVGAPKIETSLVDEKTSFTSPFSEFPGYHILTKNNNTELMDYTDIFSINEVSYSTDTTGELRIELDNIPKHYDSELEKWVFDYESIQEWVYNKKTNEFFFVCGFNITEEDVENYNKGSHYITIYLSLVGNLDLEVYNDKGILVGYVGNKAKQEDDVVDLV